MPGGRLTANIYCVVHTLPIIPLAMFIVTIINVIGVHMVFSSDLIY